jgi:histidine ammonia-lyase
VDLERNACPDRVAVADVARHHRAVRLSKDALPAVSQARAIVERRLSDGKAHYGINTGFGSLAKQRISDTDLADLQRNLIRSHAAGVGEPLPVDVTRAMMFCMANSLSRGHSGVRPVLIQLLVDMLNRGVTPVVPSTGSVGASGDLAPLAAVALAMIGEGQCSIDAPSGVRGPGATTPAPRRVMKTSQAFAKAGLKPITLAAKEGLALINGTHLMAGSGALTMRDTLDGLWPAAIAALAMSIDACRASHSFLDPRLELARLNLGHGFVPSALRTLLAGSEIVTSHLVNDSRVQDPYSLRAAPTVLSAVAHQLGYVVDAIDAELMSVTDNPLVFAAGIGHDDGPNLATRLAGIRDKDKQHEAIISGANFHGMPLAIPLDSLAIALCHIGGVSERRSYLMTGAFEPESHLKPFLAPQPGLQSGLMIAQYTAAACINEMITLATPASVSNISTCAGMEDYNSFGPRSAAKAARSLDLCTHVIAIELLIAAAGLDLHRPLRSGRGVEEAHAIIRSVVKPMGQDRHLTPDIEAIAHLIRSGAFAHLAPFHATLIE